ncbi:hypothetical protein AB0L65_59525 [Nonomuraea sp. NPDC052116]|uniref:hypothetical protein n=1 Tax=Nonomuraea sp. NPDC052116 TaxID=3155665 RepID=UPI00342C0301
MKSTSTTGTSVKSNHRLEIIGRLKEARYQIRELIALVVALSFAVNLISSAMFEALGVGTSLLVGGIIISVCTGYVIVSRLEGRRFEAVIEAAFVIRDDNPSHLVDTSGYEFGREFYTVAHAVFEENSALKDQWTIGEPALANFDQMPPIPSSRLVEEVAEYVFIQKLSTHLSDYFNRLEIDGRRVRRFERSDLPHVLLSNRVLELISRDYRDRPGFDQHELSDGGWQIVTSYSGKKMYSRFDLTLPEGSNVRRGEDGSLLIDSPAIRLKVVTTFTRFRSDLPYDYLERVLGLEIPVCRDYDIKFLLSGEIKNPLFGRRSLWQYHGWVESFIDEIRRNYDYDTVFARLNWEASEMLLRALDSAASLDDSVEGSGLDGEESELDNGPDKHD